MGTTTFLLVRAPPPPFWLNWASPHSWCSPVKDRTGRAGGVDKGARGLWAGMVVIREAQCHAVFDQAGGRGCREGGSLLTKGVILARTFPKAPPLVRAQERDPLCNRWCPRHSPILSWPLAWNPENLEKAENQSVNITSDSWNSQSPEFGLKWL